MAEQEQVVSSSSSTPEEAPVIHVKAEGNNRTAFWVLISVVVGFFLPICSCLMFFFFTIAGLGVAGSTPRAGLGSGDAVAVVRVEGAITSGDRADLSSGAVSGIVIEDLRAAATDPSVKAIVLRVDSPGGSVTGSAQIYEAVHELEKPVVVSMIATAASGGYYVSAPADYIFARADTVTGSIGVILTLFNAEALLENIGVDVTMIASGPNKTIGTPWEELTPEQRQILEEFVGESYEDFLRVVADGRGMSIDEVRQLADGRIYTGRQALALGLVDELGNLQNAIDKAAELGGIVGEPRIVEYDRLPRWSQFLRGFVSRLTRTQADQILEIITRFTTPSLEYRYVGPGGQ